MKPKYPWLVLRNGWTGESIKDENGEPVSALIHLERGWYKAFGEQMVDELNEILVKHNSTETYRIDQIKEKYGSLRWYDSGYSYQAQDELSAWSTKYSHLSEETCVICGAPAKIRTDMGWISPYCDKHYHQYKHDGGFNYDEVDLESEI